MRGSRNRKRWRGWQDKWQDKWWWRGPTSYATICALVRGAARSAWRAARAVIVIRERLLRCRFAAVSRQPHRVRFQLPGRRARRGFGGFTRRSGGGVTVTVGVTVAVKRALLPARLAGRPHVLLEYHAHHLERRRLDAPGRHSGASVGANVASVASVAFATFVTFVTPCAVSGRLDASGVTHAGR